MPSIGHGVVAAGLTITDMHYNAANLTCAWWGWEWGGGGGENNKKNHSHHHGQSHCL